MHDLARSLHLRFKRRIISPQLKTAGRFHPRQHIALANTKPGQHILGQDNADRITDGSEFEVNAHGECVTTNVITVNQWAQLWGPLQPYQIKQFMDMIEEFGLKMKD
jgi:hypothetical protein